MNGYLLSETYDEDAAEKFVLAVAQSGISVADAAEQLETFLE